MSPPKQMLSPQDDDRFGEYALILSVFQSVPSAVLVGDDNGRVILANPAAITGLRLDENTQLAGRNLGELVPGAEVLLDVCAQKEQRQVTIDFPDGSRRWLGYTCSGMAKNTLRVSVFRDMTMLMELERRRFRAEQLAQVGEMAAKMGHEIKNPIASILAGLQALQQDETLSGSAGQILLTIMDEVRNLDRTIAGLLQSARLHDTVLKPERLSEMMRNCVFSRSLIAGQRGIDLTLKEGPEDLLVHIDLRAMGRVLDNLVLNSIEACSQGHRIRVGWNELEEDKIREVFAGSCPSVVSIFVEDDGPGISWEISENLFDAFVTTKPSGTGLGLSVVHDLVGNHGGVVRVSSRYGVGQTGTRFEIWLPAGSREPCFKVNPGCTKRPHECAVKRSGAEYACWTVLGKLTRMESGQWNIACRTCPVFEGGDLEHKLKEGLNNREHGIWSVRRPEQE